MKAEMGPHKAKEMPLPARFAAALQKLVKKPCLFYDTGPAVSSFIDLHFGRRIERAGQPEHPDRNGEQSRYEGEWSLFVGCAWRVDSPTEVVCGCWDDKDEDGQMRAGLDRLVGQSVRRILASPPSWDLTVEFENGLLLRVFCDQTNDDEGADNYSLFGPEHIFTVGTLSDLFVEPRGEESAEPV